MRHANEQCPASEQTAERVEVVLDRFAGRGLHQQKRSVGCEALGGVTRGGYWIAQIMERIEVGNQVVVVAGESGRVRYLEDNTFSHATSGGGLARSFERRPVRV